MECLFDNYFYNNLYSSHNKFIPFLTILCFLHIIYRSAFSNYFRKGVFNLKKKKVPNMDTVVLKFGGSSVADNIKLSIVANKIIDFYNKNNNVVVVVSAQRQNN